MFLTIVGTPSCRLMQLPLPAQPYLQTLPPSDVQCWDVADLLDTNRLFVSTFDVVIDSPLILAVPGLTLLIHNKVNTIILVAKVVSDRCDVTEPFPVMGDSLMYHDFSLFTEPMSRHKARSVYIYVGLTRHHVSCPKLREALL